MFIHIALEFYWSYLVNGNLTHISSRSWYFGVYIHCEMISIINLINVSTVLYATLKIVRTIKS